MSVVTDLRHVTDVACTKDEIFVLEGERNIIRIAYHPENNIIAPSELESKYLSIKNTNYSCFLKHCLMIIYFRRRFHDGFNISCPN